MTKMSQQDRMAFFAANAPIDSSFALRMWGNSSATFNSDDERRAFFAMWAMACVEWASALEDAFEECSNKRQCFIGMVSL